MSDEIEAGYNKEQRRSLVFRRIGGRLILRLSSCRQPWRKVENIKKHEIERSVDDTRILDKIVELIKDERIFEARRLIVGAIATSGETSFLLRRLADIERVLGDNDSAAKSLAAALTLAPEDPEILFEHVRALYAAGRYTEIKAVVENLVQSQRQRSEIRSIIGDTYRTIGWHAHTVDAYGNLLRIPWRSRYFKFVSWFACGAPLNTRRSSAWRFECMVEDNYAEKSAERQRTCADLRLLPDRVGHTAEDLDTFLIMHLTLRMRLQKILSRRINRPGMIGFLGVAWLIPFAAFRTLGKSDTTSASFLGIVYAEVTLPISMFITKAIGDSALRGRALVNPIYFWFPLLLAIIELWISGPTLISFLWVLLADVAGISAIWMSPLYNCYYSQSHLLRENLRLYLTDGFLELLSEVSKGGQANRDYERAQWISKLSEIAWILEAGYVHHFGTRDRTIRTLVNERAQEAASFARMVAASIAMPDKKTWKRVISDLKYATATTISGDIGGLVPRDNATQIKAKPRYGKPTVTIFRVVGCVAIIGAAIGILLWSKNRQDVGTAITAVVTTVTTALAGLMLGSTQEKIDIGPG